MNELTYSKGPDILEVISDLSSDEVFTPPRVAAQVLDLFPAEVWSNSGLRWLDPGCKTGVFLREITRRLMSGLVDEIPDEQERLLHILENQVFGIAITELTSLMSRRTLYCSKNAAGDHSVVRMPTSGGNIWFERVEHTYINGKCRECSAAQSQMERDNRDNYAYAFIHEAGRIAVWKDLGMKFDVIVGNPPYQMDSDGSNRTIPIYNLFVEEAKKLNPSYISMIIPSRWMATGLGLRDFRSSMLADKRIRHIVDFPNASEVFPGVEIKAGVCYFVWDRDNPGACDITVNRDNDSQGPVSRDLGEFDILVRDSRSLQILHKVLHHQPTSLTEILAVDKEFGMTSNFSGYSLIDSLGSIAIYANKGTRRVQGWIRRGHVTKSEQLIDKWKVLIPKAGSDGGQRLPDVVLGKPLVASPPSVCTQTYLFVYIDGEDQALSVESYLKTRFVRFLISLRKISQDATRSTYTWVPQQTWDRTWTDEELYEKYGITEDERAYIESMVKEMS